MSLNQLSTSLRGGLLFFVSLLALLLAASAISAQPPHGHAGKSQDPEDLGPHGDFARRGEKGSQEAMEAADLENAPRVAWTDPQGGLWSDPANWSAGAPPGENDVAVIDAAGEYRVELDIDAIVGALELGGGEGTRTLVLPRSTLKIRGTSRVGAGGMLHLDGGIVTGPGDLDVEGRLLWTRGSVSGTGVLRVAPSGRLSVEGPERKVLGLRALENAGQMEWSGTGAWVLTFQAPVRNLEGGEVVLAADALWDIYGPPGSVFENAGTVHKIGSGTVTFEPPFRNSGEVRVDEGALDLLAGFAQTAGATEVAAGAAIGPAEGFEVEGGTVSGEGDYPRPAEEGSPAEAPE